MSSDKGKVEKRYRFSLDLDDQAQSALNDFLSVLDSMTIRERGAWISRALTFYHDSVITGAAKPEDSVDSHLMLMAQTLAFKNEYQPDSPLGEGSQTLANVLRAKAQSTGTQPTEPPATQPSESATHQPPRSEPKPETEPAHEQINTTQPPAPQPAADTKPTPMKQRLSAMM
jgi:hypothetical protein